MERTKRAEKGETHEETNGCTQPYLQTAETNRAVCREPAAEEHRCLTGCRTHENIGPIRCAPFGRLVVASESEAMPAENNPLEHCRKKWQTPPTECTTPSLSKSIFNRAWPCPRPCANIRSQPLGSECCAPRIANAAI